MKNLTRNVGLNARTPRGKSIRSYYYLVITSKQGERSGFSVRGFRERREKILRNATRKHLWTAAACRVTPASREGPCRIQGRPRMSLVSVLFHATRVLSAPDRLAS